MKNYDDENIQNLAEELSKGILHYIHDRFDQSEFIIALSGGSTPQILYQKLGDMLRSDYKDKINNIHIIQVDERFVSAKHDRNNMKMIKSRIGEGPTYYPIPTVDEVDSAEESAEKYQKTVKELLKDKLIDLIVLGMGTDGHTASLFPNNLDYINSKDTDRWFISVDEDSVEDPRISMTTNLINLSKRKVLLIHGEKKKAVLESAMKLGNENTYPIFDVIGDCKIYSQYPLDI